VRELCTPRSSISPLQGRARPSVRSLLAAAALLVAASAAPAQEGTTGQAGPARGAAFAGEILRYDMTILGIEAGELVLKSAADEWEGRPALRIEMTVETNEDISRIFLVRDSLRSWVDAASLASFCFHKRTAEGHRTREEVITFDQARGVARRGDKVILFDPLAFDSLSSVYLARTLPLDGSAPIRMTVVAKDAFLLDVDWQGRQTIKTPAGTFRTVRIEPKNPGESLIARGRNLVLWLTDDERHLPVQIRSGLAIGNLVGKLKSIQPAPGPLTPAP
jgi:hypothetical protein